MISCPLPHAFVGHPLSRKIGDDQMPRLDGFPHPGRCHIPGLVKLDAKRNIPHRIKADARFPEAAPVFAGRT